MAESIAKNELDEFKCDANEAITFRLVRKPEDIEDEEKGFPPDMTHQVFGESELIFGYKDLNISIYYTAARLIPCLRVTHSSKVDAKEHGVNADNVEAILSAEMPAGCLSNLDNLRARLPAEANFKPFGEMIDSYTATAKGGQEHKFSVYHTSIDEPGFREYHDRLQSFIKFYIDAASYIDADDPQWDFYLLFENYKEDGEPRLAIAGYMTIYNFYAYPTHIRPRISQVLVLPPFQRMGIGSRLIQTFYNICYPKSEVLDITVEDPSDNFQRVRTFVDVRNCLKLKAFQPEELSKGFSHDMVHEAQHKLKLSKLQARRVYEILSLKNTDQSDKADLRKFRLMVKQRLNIPFLKTRRTFQKLEKGLSQEELTQTLGMMKKEHKFQFLEQSYQEDVAFYRQVLERIAAS